MGVGGDAIRQAELREQPPLRAGAGVGIYEDAYLLPALAPSARAQGVGSHAPTNKTVGRREHERLTVDRAPSALGWGMALSKLPSQSVRLLRASAGAAVAYHAARKQQFAPSARARGAVGVRAIELRRAHAPSQSSNGREDH